MPWECFLIEKAAPVTEYVVCCSQKHRTVVEELPGVEFSEAPSEPGEGWPEVCPECAEAMVYDDGFEKGWHSKMGGWVWVRPDTGEEHRHQSEFGAGAMFDATEWSAASQLGPDGKAWGVVLPPAKQWDVWVIDHPASSGGRWTRTGTPPKLDVNPSILTASYHGFLRDGVLTDSLPDRPLP